MKHSFAAACLLLLCTSVAAQTGTHSKDSSRAELTKVADTGIVARPDSMMRFKGGFSEMTKFILNHVKYPREAMDLGIEGEVMIRFVVDTAGNILSATVTGKKQHELLEKEALRVLWLTSGKWIPAFYNGRRVKSVGQIPINFELEE